MGPARFHCATLLSVEKEGKLLIIKALLSLPIVLFQVFLLFYFVDFVITTKNILDMFNTSLALKKNKIRKKKLFSRARF